MKNSIKVKIKNFLTLIFLVTITFGANPKEANALSINLVKESAEQAVEFIGYKFRPNLDLPISRSEIHDLSSQLKNPDKAKSANRYIGSLKLNNSQLENLFMEVAVYQRVLSREESADLMSNLQGTPGFRSTLSKVVRGGEHASIRSVQGHLAELHLSNAINVKGGKVISIGDSFNDGYKSANTDLDIGANWMGRNILIEVKDYTTSGSYPSSINVRKDMQSLISYQETLGDNNALKVFTLNPKPANPKKYEELESIARDFGVKMIYGNPEEVANQIKSLI